MESHVPNVKKETMGMRKDGINLVATKEYPEKMIYVVILVVAENPIRIQRNQLVKLDKEKKPLDLD